MVEKLQLATIFQNGMVLQRDVLSRIWGYATPGAQVVATLDEQAPVTATTDANGSWEIQLPMQAAGGPHQLVVQAGDATLTITDILFGDVWVLAGQSNMQLWMGRVKARFPDELKAANNPAIRSFKMPQIANFNAEQSDFPSGEWVTATADHIADISALGYFFAMKLNADEQVPIGLLYTAIGGTPIEAWLADEQIQKLHAQTFDYEQLRQPGYIEEVEATEAARDNQYWAELDAADQGLQANWQLGQADTTAWTPISLTSAWDSPFKDSGVTWVQKTFTMPTQLIGTNAEIRLGTLTDGDEVYVNGQKVGETGYMFPPRNYPIGLIEAEMTIVIRLKICYGQGGFTRGKQHVLVNDANEVVFDLDQHGPWQMQRGTGAYPDKLEQTFFQYKPSGLFNGMIAPLQNLALKGFLYYQGESNDAAPEGYGQKLLSLITDWRQRFNQGALPWINVQLPNFGLTPELDWVKIRAEQMQVLALPNTALVVTIDVGEYNDLHPTDKQTVGERVALAAEKIAYGRDVHAAGPLATKAQVVGEDVVISFTADTAALKQTADITVQLATDQGTLEAVALIYGQELRIKKPVDTQIYSVSYAWQVNPTATLYDVFNLPAPPFKLGIG